MPCDSKNLRAALAYRQNYPVGPNLNLAEDIEQQMAKTLNQEIQLLRELESHR